MDKKSKNTIQLGMFVSIGLVIFIAVIYYLGSMQNLFGSTTDVYGIYKNVSGLKVGNNVRFSGINVGTVTGIELVSDSTVKVTFSITKDAAQYIKKDSKASIGSEGLMGDKIINISTGSAHARAIKDEDYIRTTEPIEIEEVLTVLNETGDNARRLTSNLADLSKDISNGKGLAGHLLTDSSLVNDFEKMFASLQQTSAQAQAITKDFATISERTKRGEGTLGRLTKDEALANSIENVIDTLEVTSQRTREMSDNLVTFTDKLNSKGGPVDKFLTDSSFAENIDETLVSVKATANELGRTTDRINSSWLFNFLFKKGKEKGEHKGFR